ncbi:unnamed protein product [Symbiodinium microadriaticum]|nr:unnamed protein product [Symbiodinium microadriaticum]
MDPCTAALAIVSVVGVPAKDVTALASGGVGGVAFGVQRAVESSLEASVRGAEIARRKEHATPWAVTLSAVGGAIYGLGYGFVDGVADGIEFGFSRMRKVQLHIDFEEVPEAKKEEILCSTCKSPVAADVPDSPADASRKRTPVLARGQIPDAKLKWLACAGWCLPCTS